MLPSTGGEEGTTPSDFDPSLPDNAAENEAASDAAEEEAETGDVSFDTPDWVDEDMPDPNDASDD